MAVAPCIIRAVLIIIKYLNAVSLDYEVEILTDRFGEIDIKVLSDEGLPTSPSGGVTGKMAAVAALSLLLFIF